jgi:hypothetical protein
MDLTDGSENPPSRGRLSRIAVIVVAGLVAAIGGVVAFRAFGSSRRPSAGAGGYYVRFPSLAAAPSKDNSGGGARITIETNLPEGTRVAVISSEGDYACCPSVKSGQVSFDLDNMHCLNAQTPQSDGFRASVAAAPVMSEAFLQHLGIFADCPRGSCRGQPQPSSVLRVLGQRFQRLHGTQVQQFQGSRYLIASQRYSWPPDTCASARASSESYPNTCEGPTEPLFVAFNETVQGVPGGFIQAVEESGGCLLYSNATEEYRSTTSWPEFRDRFRTWVQSLGSLTRSAGGVDPWSIETSHVGPEAVVFHGTSFPRSFVATYSFRGRIVATATLEWVPNPSPNVVPSYHFSEIDLH